MSDREEQQRRFDCIASDQCPGCGAQFPIDIGTISDIFDGCPHCGDNLDYDESIHIPDEEDDEDD